VGAGSATSRRAQADNQEPDDCGCALAGGVSLKFFSRVIVNDFCQ